MTNVSSIKTTVVKYRPKPQAAVQYEIVLSSGTLVYNQNKSDTIQGSLEWQVYRIEGDKRTRISNNATGMECYCGYSDSPSTTANTNTTDNVTFKDGGAAEVKYESGVTDKFTIIYGEKKNGVFTQLARLDVPVNVVGENGKDSPSLQFNCPSCLVRLSNDTYGTPVVATSNVASLCLGGRTLTDTFYWFATTGDSFKINIGDSKKLSFNNWWFNVSNSGGDLMFSLVEVEEGALETISLPIFAYSESTSTYQYREVSYAIARKGDPNVSIDFDNNNATLLYNSSTGKYVNAPVVTNVSVLVGSEDISKKAIVHITTVNLTGTVKRGLNSYSFDKEGIDDEIGGEGIIGIKVTGFLKEDSSVGSIIAHYEYENKMYTATFNVTRSVGRYAVDIIATPTQVSYNQTTGLASSSNVVATINAIDINGKRQENAIFANYGAMRYRNLGEGTWTRPDKQNVSKLEITPDFTKRGIEFSFVDASNKQLDYETVPFSSVTNGGDAYLVNVASMNVAVVLTSISYGTPTGDVTNVIYLTKNNAVLSSGVEYNVPGDNGDEHTFASDSDTPIDISYNGWVFNYSYQEGRLKSSIVRVEENSPTSVHIPIDVIYPTDNITRSVMISYSAIQKGPAGRSYKPNTPVLYDPTKTYEWNDQYRDFIYYAFKVNNKGEQDDEKGVLSYFQYGVKEYGMKITDTPPSAKGGDTNWEYVSEYKSIIVNCLFGTNAVLGGMVFTAQTQTSEGKNDKGEANIIIDGAKGKLIANDAAIRGTIDATSGSFDRCTINNTCRILQTNGSGWFLQGGSDPTADAPNGKPSWWLGYGGEQAGQFTITTYNPSDSSKKSELAIVPQPPSPETFYGRGILDINSIYQTLASFNQNGGMNVQIGLNIGEGIRFTKNSSNNTFSAFVGAGHGCLNGVIQGYQLNVITSGQIDISKGNTVYCNGNGTNLILPTRENCSNVLGTTGAFALDLTIIGASGASNFRVYGKYHNSTTDCYLLNNDHGDNWYATMSKGDVLTLKLIYTGTSFYAYIVNMQN